MEALWRPKEQQKCFGYVSSSSRQTLSGYGRRMYNGEKCAKFLHMLHINKEVLHKVP